MKETGHAVHKSRFIDKVLGFILRSRSWYNKEPYCSCIYDFEDSGSCRQLNFMNGNFTVAGPYGESVFICRYCYVNDKEEIDRWSKGRRDFIDRVQVEDPELWAISTRNI